jgi:basic membrane protein A and related proteins
MKNRRRVLGTLLVLGAVALASVAGLALAAGSHAKAGPIKAAWLYCQHCVHNDGGWSQAHDEGRLYVQKMLGSKIQTTYKEDVGNAQVPQVVASLVRDGYKIIFGTSFGMFNSRLTAKYPDVLFEQATGSEVTKNLSEYFGAAEDTIYLSGMAAGAATKSGVIGYVVPFGIPEVVRHANAFALGAQATHPGAKLRLIWTNAWFSPPKEKAAAQNLVAAGADVLGQNVDSPAAGQFAESKGVPWVGYDSDASKFAPKSWLTASVYNWGPYYLRRVKAAIGGTWKSGFYYGSIKDGFTGLAKYGPRVTAKTKAAIAAKEAAILSGKFYEFEGPLYDQSGKLRVPKGKRLTIEDLYSMNWLAKGVIGSIPSVPAG